MNTAPFVSTPRLPRRLLGAAGLLLALLLGPAPETAAEEVLLDGIAAQVGSQIVLISEVQALAKPMEERMRQAGAPASQIRAMHLEALDRLIEAKMIEGIVHRLELEATDEEVDDAVLGIAQDTGLTLAQLERSVESHGLTIEEYRSKIKTEIERNKVIGGIIRSRVRIEPSEVRELYERKFGDQQTGGEEVRLRHIVVMSGEGSGRTPHAACLIVDDARKKIVEGQILFSDLARRITEMNPERGGELGWIHVDEIAGWMAPSVAKMKPGDVSESIQTPFGCNLIELVDRRAFTPVSFEQVEERLTQELSGRKMESAYADWLEEQRKQTYIAKKGFYAGEPGAPQPLAR